MSDVTIKVSEIIAERLSKDLDSLTESSNIIADLGADSLDIAEIMMDLEDAFGVKVEDDEAESLNTIGNIVKYIEGKLAK